MMGLCLSVYDEKDKEVTLEFVFIVSIALTKSEVLMDKVQEILLNNNIDISHTRFSCLDGTKTMSSERTGLQRRICNAAPFSIYIKCRCHRLALYFKHLFDHVLWLNQLTGFYLGCGKVFTILEKPITF